jgi:hypothetical protein
VIIRAIIRVIWTCRGLWRRLRHRSGNINRISRAGLPYMFTDRASYLPAPPSWKQVIINRKYRLTRWTTDMHKQTLYMIITRALISTS